MKTATVKVSMDFSRMLYTVHLFTEDLLEFSKYTDSMPGPVELWELAEGLVTRILEIPEELVELPKELFQIVFLEMRKYCPELSSVAVLS